MLGLIVSLQDTMLECTFDQRRNVEEEEQDAVVPFECPSLICTDNVLLLIL